MPLKVMTHFHRFDQIFNRTMFCDYETNFG